MKQQFKLTINGKALNFNVDQVPTIRSALDEAIKNPGKAATRSDNFIHVHAFLDAAEPSDNQNQTTDC